MYVKSSLVVGLKQLVSFLFFFAGKGSIDKANEEVRNIILRIWPKTSMELLDKVVQPPGVRE